jgi:hypothetical protein
MPEKTHYNRDATSGLSGNNECFGRGKPTLHDAQTNPDCARQPTAHAIQNEVLSKGQLSSSMLNLTFEPAKVAKSSAVKY